MNTENSAGISAAALKQVLQSLQRDAALLQQLGPLLRQQYLLLSTRQTNQLLRLNEQTNPLLQQLQQHQQTRQQALAQLGLSATPAGFKQLLARLPASIREASQQLLDDVQQQTIDCQQQNQKNGELLANQRQLMQRLLGLSDNTSYPAMQLR